MLTLQPLSESEPVLSPDDVPVFSPADIKLEMLSSNVSKFTSYFITMYTVSQKNCANLFLLGLRQISTNFGNFGQKNGKEAKIMRGVLIFHLT